MKKSIVLVWSSFVLISANDIPLPDKAHRAYSVIVEAGAKLLEFDIIRENLNTQEKQLVAIVDKEKYGSLAGRALSALVPLEKLAPSFDELVPVFIALQNDLGKNPENEKEQAAALKGLAMMLESPEVLHVVLPLAQYVNKGYQEAMNCAPTQEFIRAIQRISHRRFLLHYCDDAYDVISQPVLAPEVYLFYSIVKQAVANIFSHLLKDVPHVDIDAQPKPANSQQDDQLTLSSSPVAITDATASVDLVKNEFMIHPGSIAADELNMASISSGAMPTVLQASQMREAIIIDPQDMLHKAILNNSIEEMRQAINAGADVNRQHNGKSPLFWAVILKRSNTIEYLLECGAKDDVSIIQHAVNQQDIKSAVLIAKSCNFNLDAVYAGDTLIRHASNAIDFESALILLKSGANPDLRSDKPMKGGSMLGLAVNIIVNKSWPQKTIDSAFELIQEILNRGYDVNNLWQLEFNNMGVRDLEIIKFMKKNGVDVNHQVIRNGYAGSWTPLFLAIRSHDKAKIKLLLDYGADINQKAEPDGIHTPFSFALASGTHTEIIELLIQRGAKL